ncbi:AraC family transcriptional regulator [Alcaligenes faecalis subsp. faecalis NCIB 8687]|nr:AraC family transcriptional regulator [Alcaligenes faecalis subsp. faecalis NCIB 8687]
MRVLAKAQIVIACETQQDLTIALNITPFYLSQLTKEFFNDSPKALIDRQVVL